MKIAKIVSSNSHLDYVARVIDSLDAEDPPSTNDYGFAQFVFVSTEGEEIIGVIHNSMLVNPEYANFGPRLSPKPELGNFSPDFINEQGLLIGILLLGTIDPDGGISHGVPRRVIPPGQEVFKLDNRKLREFHSDKNGRIMIHYYSQVVSHSGQFAIPLLESIIDQLVSDSGPEERRRLEMLKRSIEWQRIFGGARL